MTERVALPLCIREVSGSDTSTETGYHDGSFVVVISLSGQILG
jgi:hypothetical protein